jgi:hypothetical protein
MPELFWRLSFSNVSGERSCLSGNAAGHYLKNFTTRTRSAACPSMTA